MTEIQAAIGRYQLKQLPLWSSDRKRNGQYLTDSLAGIDGVRVTRPPEGVEHAYYKYYFFIVPDMLSRTWDRDRIVAEIHSSGTPCFTGSCPEIYREKAFSDLYGQIPRRPVAAELGQTSIMLNVHPGIDESHLDMAVKDVKRVIGKAVR